MQLIHKAAASTPQTDTPRFYREMQGFRKLSATNILVLMDYQSFAAGVRRLDRAIGAIEPLAAAAGVTPPAGREWFDLLRNKLLAQLDMPPLLVVAIVGGTNIGKSSIFNQLAGEVASAASPLAAGTKHPVCLVPPPLADPALLARLFEPFRLHVWHSADDPLGDSSEDRLFWRVGKTMPPRLLLLDAPDVDSDAEVNWHRAERFARRPTCWWPC